MKERQHPSCISPEALLHECQISRTKSGGPGGQHRNKVESAVVITHCSGVSGQASERRSQHENRKVAVARLRINLALAVRSDHQIEKPSDLWNQRCRGQKISISPNHEEFPCILAEALDFIAQSNFQIATAASKLNCSTSQLIKLIKLEVLAFQMVNEQRKKLGLSLLK